MGSEWIALPAGLIIATLATMVGFGGGVLWMPFLLLVTRLDPAQAVTTSLIIQVAGMGSGGLAVLKSRKADFSLSFFLSACAFIGIPIGVTEVLKVEAVGSGCITGCGGSSFPEIVLVGCACIDA